MRRLWQTFTTLNLPSKVIVLGLIFILLLALSGSVGGFISWVKEKRFEKEKAVLQAEIEEKRRAADEAERRAVEAESEKIKFQLALELAGKQAEKAMEKVNAAEQEYTKELERIDADVDLIERCRRLCAKLKLTTEQCGCTEANNRN